MAATLRSGGAAMNDPAGQLFVTFGQCRRRPGTSLERRTTRDAVDVFGRYLSLSSAFIRLSWEQNDTEGRAVLDDTEIPEDVRDLLVERDIAAIAQVLPQMVGIALSDAASRVELRMTRAR